MSARDRVIVSWDVGVVHLGLCILRGNGDHSEILHWDNINLLEDDESYRTCGEAGKDGVPCRLRAIWVLRLPGGPYYCCGRHQKGCLRRCDRDPADYYSPTTHGHRCVGVRRDGQPCPTRAKWKAPEGYLCTIHRRRSEKVLAKACTLQKIVRRQTMKIPISELQLLLMRHLDTLVPVMASHQVTHCYIENQPGKTAGSMKSIATTIASWAVLRGQIDHTDGWRLERVQYVNACNKIKLASHEGQLCVRKATGKDKYKLTKALAVSYTRQLLADCPEWLEVLEGFTKKDDPCDAYLQGRYILTREC